MGLRFLCQSPYVGPYCAREGGSGHYIDRCINTTLAHSFPFKLPLMQEIPPPPPPGISMEEANELRENIEKLEGELVEMRAELAAKEDANNQLSKQRERGGGMV